jgi:para-aminobenzoate synthetase/4-amino-4-deoxychorismate lyase
MASLRWLDGLLAPGHPLARSAPGVFTTLRVEDGAPAFLAAHLARLARDARALGLAWPPPWDPEDALHELARAAPRDPHAVRILWTPPHLGLDALPVPPGPEEWNVLVDDPGRTPLPRPAGIKTSARAEYEHLAAEARIHGADEALVVAAGGELVEGTRTNVFLALDGELATPPMASGALPGVMRGALLTDLEREPLRDARGRAWRTSARALARADLAAAEEVLLTNAVRRVVGVASWRALHGERVSLPGRRGPVAGALHARAERLERASRA